MADDVLMQKLSSIDRCVRQIAGYLDGDLSRLDDQLVQDAVVLNLQRACEQAIDAASRVASIRALGVPADSADAFGILERAGMLSGPVAARMKSMVGFRNVVVHAYRELDGQILRSVVRDRLGDFAALCRELSVAM